MPQDQPVQKQNVTRSGGLAPLSMTALNSDFARPATPRAGLLHTPLSTGAVPSAPRSKRSERRTGERCELPSDKLVEEGVASFSKAFDDLLGAIAAKHPAHA